MAKFRVTGDMRFAFVIEVEAESLTVAAGRVLGMSYKAIEAGGIVDRATAGVDVDDVIELDQHGNEIEEE